MTLAFREMSYIVRVPHRIYYNKAVAVPNRVS